jgi:hypothetical protein
VKDVIAGRSEKLKALVVVKFEKLPKVSVHEKG